MKWVPDPLLPLEVHPGNSALYVAMDQSGIGGDTDPAFFSLLFCFVWGAFFSCPLEGTVYMCIGGSERKSGLPLLPTLK